MANMKLQDLLVSIFEGKVKLINIDTDEVFEGEEHEVGTDLISNHSEVWDKGVVFSICVKSNGVMEVKYYVM